VNELLEFKKSAQAMSSLEAMKQVKLSQSSFDMNQVQKQHCDGVASI
jgi:hypothetical protein